MKNICPECGSNLAQVSTGGVDAAAPLGDAPGHDDKTVSVGAGAGASSQDGGHAGGALEEALSVLVTGAGAGAGLGSLAATAGQQNQLREWAEQTGRLISEESWRQHPLLCSGTAEHEVRVRPEDGRAIKRTHPGTFGFIPRRENTGWRSGPATPAEYLIRWLIQNLAFRGDIRLEGVMISTGLSMLIGQPAGGISLVISQRWVDARDPDLPHPTESQIASLLEELGFTSLPGSFFGWWNGQEKIAVLDAKPDNFIVTDQGIVPIDLQLACEAGSNLLIQLVAGSGRGTATAPAPTACRCVNPDCPTEVRARLARWCAPQAMNLAGADEKLVAQLVAHGLVLEVADFYRLKFGELMELEGVTETRAKDFLAAIAASKTRDWWQALAGLGIPQVDAGVAETLARAFKNLDDLAGAPLARLTASAGEAVAQSVARWFSEGTNRRLIQRLGKAGLF